MNDFYSMDKRGQATLFIILGIVLVVIIVLLFTTKTIELPRRSVESSQVSSVDAYVESCVSKEVKTLLLGLRKQGGMYKVGNSYPIGPANYFYAIENTGRRYNTYYEDTESLRTYLIGIVEGLLKDSCNPCNQFSGLTGCDNFKATVFSNDEGILININNDKLTLTRGTSTVDLSNMNVKIDDNFFKEFDVAKYIMDRNYESIIKNGDWFDYDYYVISQYDPTLNIISDYPTVDGNIKRFWIWYGDGTKEEAFYFAIKK